jgi:hypothetical protein
MPLGIISCIMVRMQTRQILTGIALGIAVLGGCAPNLNLTQTHFTFLTDNIIYALRSGDITLDDIRLREYLTANTCDFLTREGACVYECFFIADYSDQSLQQKPVFYIYGTPGTSGFSAQFNWYGLITNPSSCFELDHVVIQTPQGLTIGQPIINGRPSSASQLEGSASHHTDLNG